MSDIILLMRSPGNIHVLDQALKSQGYSCRGASDLEALENELGATPPPRLALVDVTGFGRSVWAMCERLQSANVPFIVLSGKQELGMSSKTLSYGATSILEKPIVKASLLQLISEIGPAEPK